MTTTLSEQAYELCRAIEALPAGEQQTRCSTLAAGLRAAVASSEIKASPWTAVTDALPEDQPGTHFVYDAGTGKMWSTTTLSSWWNRKDPRGKEYDGPTITHWMWVEAPK